MAMRDQTRFLHLLEVGVSLTLPDSARDAHYCLTGLAARGSCGNTAARQQVMRWRCMRHCRPAVQRHSTQQRENERQPDERLGYLLFHCLAFLIDVWNVQQRFIEIGRISTIKYARLQAARKLQSGVATLRCRRG